LIKDPPSAHAFETIGARRAAVPNAHTTETILRRVGLIIGASTRSGNVDRSNPASRTPFAVAGGEWSPSPVMLTLSAVLGALSGGTAKVSLTFTGLSGDPQIDDVFVDPYCHG
jgi:hypothetical protein